MKGTVLLAQEGVNGTVAGTEAGIESNLKIFFNLKSLYVPQNFKTSSCIDGSIS